MLDKAVSPEELIARLNQRLKTFDCLGVGFVDTEQAINTVIKHYHDPLSAEKLRCLINLWATKIALENQNWTTRSPLKREDIPVTNLVRSMAIVQRYDYAENLQDLHESYHRSWDWYFIAEEQAQAKKFDAALQTINLMEKNATDGGVSQARALIKLATAMHEHADIRAKQVCEQAFAAINAIRAFVMPSHAQSEPYLYHELVMILAKAADYDLALEVARKNGRLSYRAKSLCLLASTMFSENPLRAKALLDEAESLINEKHSYHEDPRENWRIVTLCEVAIVTHPFDAAKAQDLLRRAKLQVDLFRRDSAAIISESYARIGDVVRAVQVIRQESSDDQASMLSNIAVIIHEYNPVLADAAFTAARHIAHRIQERPVASGNFENLANDLANIGRFDFALQAIEKMTYMEGHKASPKRTVAEGLAARGDLAQAFHIRFSISNARHFIGDLTDYCEAIENMHTGLFLTVLRDSLTILSWIAPVWNDVLERITD